MSAQTVVAVGRAAVIASMRTAVVVGFSPKAAVSGREICDGLGNPGD